MWRKKDNSGDEGGGGGLAGKVGYGTLALALSCIHNVFLIYHVDAYVNVFGISFHGFWIAEAVFLAYNSINDLIWGMVADTNVHADRTDKRGLKKRIKYVCVCVSVSVSVCVRL